MWLFDHRAGRGRVNAGRNNIRNDLPKCTTQSSGGRYRRPHRCTLHSDTRKREGVKRGRKTLHSTRHGENCTTSAERGSRSLCPRPALLVPTIRGATCVASTLPASGAAYISRLRNSTTYSQLAHGGTYERTILRFVQLSDKKLYATPSYLKIISFKFINLEI